jgi:hypothetical protein
MDKPWRERKYRKKEKPQESGSTSDEEFNMRVRPESPNGARNCYRLAGHQDTLLDHMIWQ